MFDYMEYQKRRVLTEEFEELDSTLEMLPDFSFKINLEIKSSIIPFSSIFCPSGKFHKNSKKIDFS